jgi:hypothetical protein
MFEERYKPKIQNILPSCPMKNFIYGCGVLLVVCTPLPPHVVRRNLSISFLSRFCNLLFYCFDLLLYQKIIPFGSNWGVFVFSESLQNTVQHSILEGVLHFHELFRHWYIYLTLKVDLSSFFSSLTPTGAASVLARDRMEEYH